MNDIPSGYFRDEDGMLRQLQDGGNGAIETRPNLTDDELATLHTMTKEGLISLVQRVGGAIWGYALQDDAERAEAARLKLYNLGMTATEVHKVVPALDKWFDRTSGKAPQSVAMTVKADPVSSLSSDQLAAILANLPNSPMIIPPMPKKLDID